MSKLDRSQAVTRKEHPKVMKHFTLLIVCSSLLASCQSSQDYHAGSVAEARFFAKRAVEAGVIHKGGEVALVAQKSAGKPLVGKWSAHRIDRFISRFVAQNPQLVQINLAATQGKISEKDRVRYLRILEQEQQRAAQRPGNNLVAPGALNQPAGDISNFLYPSALMQGSFPDLGAGGINGMAYY